jgi:hypothetical protein
MPVISTCAAFLKCSGSRTSAGQGSATVASPCCRDASYRYVNVVVWDSVEQFSAAHDTDRFRALIADPGLRDFPSSPALYEAIAQYDSERVEA